MSGSDLSTIVAGGLRYARAELRVRLLTWSVLGWVAFPAIGLAVLFFLREQTVMDSEINLAQIGIPGVLAMNLVSTGVVGIAGQLVTEREDGTLLRARTVPHGVAAHLFGSVFTTVVTTLTPMIAMLAVGSWLIPGVLPTTTAGWAALIGICVLGMLATLPLGAVLGAVLNGPTDLAWAALVVYASMAVSGIFYPLAALPEWLQYVGRVVPTYWLGLGLRSVLLPPAAAHLELGGSWQSGQTVLMLLIWAALGLAFAPAALRRMARRQSGSVVAAARQRTMARGY